MGGLSGQLKSPLWASDKVPVNVQAMPATTRAAWSSGADGDRQSASRPTRRAEPTRAPQALAAANDLDCVAFCVTALVQAPIVLRYWSIERIRNGPGREFSGAFHGK
jgi:hypothetical protein